MQYQLDTLTNQLAYFTRIVYNMYNWAMLLCVIIVIVVMSMANTILKASYTGNSTAYEIIRGTNPISKTYTPTWITHHNFRWSKSQRQGSNQVQQHQSCYQNKHPRQTWQSYENQREQPIIPKLTSTKSLTKMLK